MSKAHVRSGMPAWLVWILVMVTAGLFTPIWYLINRWRMNMYYDKTISTSIKNRIRLGNGLLWVYLICYVLSVIAVGITWKTGISSESYVLFLVIIIGILWPCSWFLVIHKAADSINANFLWGLLWSVIGLVLAFTIYHLAIYIQIPKQLTGSGMAWIVWICAVLLAGMAQIGSLAPVYFQFKMNHTPGLYA